MNAEQRMNFEMGRIISRWGSENFEAGRYVISAIYDWGCDIETVVRYRVGERRMRATVSRGMRVQGVE